MAYVIKVDNLRCYFHLDEGVLRAVDGVSYEIGPKKTLGVIGESGCGKTVAALSSLKIIPPPGRIVDGKILFSLDDTIVDISEMRPDGPAIRMIRGRHISMVFQEPMTSLSPVHTIGNQILEAIRLHRTPDAKQAREIALDMLDRVGINFPARRMGQYSYELSGGMRQRVMIAIALSCRPELLIADEPTTALDVTVQSQILELLQDLREEFGMAIQYITHDLGVIAQIAEDVVVMYLGKIVEKGTAADIFKSPQHPYTQQLLKSIPVIGTRHKKRLEVIKGSVPVPLNVEPECGFHTRCPLRIAGKCDKMIPAMTTLSDTHHVRCFLHSDSEEAFHDYSAKVQKHG
ncbi:MAG: ABC transporter ATP-binding protein [Spirochaetaceae bacterium]|nr:MAG: ABC transporter ATP-binding protein [Spirochaetaceae bacterium]